MDARVRWSHEAWPGLGRRWRGIVLTTSRARHAGDDPVRRTPSMCDSWIEARSRGHGEAPAPILLAANPVATSRMGRQRRIQAGPPGRRRNLWRRRPSPRPVISIAVDHPGPSRLTVAFCITYLLPSRAERNRLGPEAGLAKIEPGSLRRMAPDRGT